jgi:hypothetical protein
MLPVRILAASPSPVVRNVATPGSQPVAAHRHVFSSAQGVSKTNLAPWKILYAAGRCTRFSAVQHRCKLL